MCGSLLEGGELIRDEIIKSWKQLPYRGLSVSTGFESELVIWRLISLYFLCKIDFIFFKKNGSLNIL